MAGIYVHIPFCKQACTYCNFHFSTSLRNKNELIDALLCEIKWRAKEIHEPIETIYFGGGSPSILESDDICKIMDLLKATYNCSTLKECTLEANPDDITPQKLQQWLRAGINRLSVGVQSFFDEDLQYMHRAHNAKNALACVQEIKQNGFTNYSVDIIFGYPLLTIEKLQTNLEILLTQEVPHISCYAMTVEPNTALHHNINNKKVPAINNEQSAQHFEYVMQTLQASAYEHYEISSYCKEGMRSVHNSNYWNGVNYLGIGPSAHSYNGVERQWNVANNSNYIASIKNNTIPMEKEILTATQKTNEYIMIKLRTKEGIDIANIPNEVLQAATHYIHTNKLVLENNFLKLTHEGKFFADAIASDLFVLNS